MIIMLSLYFFFQAEDGIRYRNVTGVQTCALPIFCCKASLYMAEKTLQQMFKGGIYDHIGFGFSRYATDRAWLVPHFEKMLYDNEIGRASCRERASICESAERVIKNGKKEEERHQQ